MILAMHKSEPHEALHPMYLPTRQYHTLANLRVRSALRCHHGHLLQYSELSTTPPLSDLLVWFWTVLAVVRLAEPV